LYPPTGLPWFALSVRPRREKYVASLLRNKGYSEYLPTYRTNRLRGKRLTEHDVPLFPGYVFCRFDPAARLPILKTEWVNFVLGIGNTPVAIPERELAAVRAVVESGAGAEPWPFLQVGQWVHINRGPLFGIEGILLNFKKQQRLVVSVSLLQRSVATEIDREWVTPLSAAPGGPRAAGLGVRDGTTGLVAFRASSAG
jgi:transcription antitermination factor NusG